MKPISLKNQTALVTGASSGLGVDFARQLAGLGADLVLVARRKDQLQAVAAEIEKTYGVSAQAIPLDLAAPGAVQGLCEQLAAQGKPVDILVNNAGYGRFGPFADLPWEQEKAMLELDILVLTELTKRFLPGMLERRRGYILLVASIGAYQPSPTYATYSAAKSYVLMFGEALSYELRRSGVSVTVVSPGVTATEFLKVAGQKPTLYQRSLMMHSSDVARIGIQALLAGRPSVVPGWMNALTIFAVRFVPRRWQAAMANMLMTGDF